MAAPWRELLAPLEARRLRSAPVYRWDGGVPRGDGVVVLVPGFLTPRAALGTMASWLRRGGYRAHVARVGLDIGCGEALSARLAEQVEAIAEREGRPVTLVGHSRGGHLARACAHRRPDAVAAVVTLGSPPLDHRGVHAAAALPAIAVTALGTGGVPGLMRASCFLGACCVTYRGQVAADLPDGVAHHAIWSPDDLVVRAARLPRGPETRIEVRATHTGMLASADAYRAIARVLAQPAVPAARRS